MKTTKITQCAFLLALVITCSALFFNACEEPFDYADASSYRNYSAGMDSNTACFLNIGYLPLVEDTELVYHTTVDAYCTDGDAKNPKFVNRKYIRCNGTDMRLFYGDPNNVGRYGWGEVHPEPVKHLKIEMDYFDEDCVFEFDIPSQITLLESSVGKPWEPMFIDPEEGFELHYTGGGSGKKAYISIGYEGNGIGKWFIDNGNGVIKFTPEEVKQISILYLEGEELESYKRAFKEHYGYYPSDSYGFPVFIQRVITKKIQFKNGKNIVANISQEDVDAIVLQLKK